MSIITTKKNERVSSDYADLAREHRQNNVPDLDGFGIASIETFVAINGEYVQVDNVLSYCRRSELADSTTRQVYSEFELLEAEGILPKPLLMGNRKFYTTAFLEPIISAIASDLYARNAGKAKSGKVHDIVSQLLRKPELIDAIAELLEEAKAR